MVVLPDGGGGGVWCTKWGRKKLLMMIQEQNKKKRNEEKYVGEKRKNFLKAKMFHKHDDGRQSLGIEPLYSTRPPKVYAGTWNYFFNFSALHKTCTLGWNKIYLGQV